MKDSLFNTLVLAAVASSLVYAAFGSADPASQTTVAQAARVYQMEKTVVAARRLPADVPPLASAQ